jgi:hypothetical protein
VIDQKPRAHESVKSNIPRRWGTREEITRWAMTASSLVLRERRPAARRGHGDRGAHLSTRQSERATVDHHGLGADGRHMGSIASTGPLAITV